MAVTLQQKRLLIVGLGVLIAFVLMNVAWAQLAAGIGKCFSAL